jgi:diguanylate cyclase (GGDEF)-like protein
LGVISRALIVRLSFNTLIASVGVLLGASIPFVASSTGDLAALFGVLALAITGSTAAEMLGQRSRAYGALTGPRSAGALHGKPERAARHDALTGLLSDYAFAARFRNILEGRRRGDRCTALLSLDLVDFTAVNATLGAAAGDLLLRHAGARLLAALRETDTLARLGADEFGVIQSDVEHPANAAALCERLLRTFEEPFDLCGHLTRVGARIGVAMFPADGTDPDALLEHAREARMRARADGEDAFRLYDEALDAELRERRALERDLAHALERGQFEIHYQPQIDIASRRMVGVEALLRWNHPERGRVSPDRFIPLAEDSGLIVPIGAWVLEQACAQAVRWHQAGAPLLRVSVNMSPVQFRQPELAELVDHTLRRSGLAAECLELEITERVLMQDTEANLETLRSDQEPWRAHLGRRLRGRQFVAQLPAPLPVRRNQGRPFVRRRAGARPERRSDRARHPQPGAQPRSGIGGRRGGKRQPAQSLGCRGLLRGPRLLFQSAGPSARDRRDDPRCGSGRRS